MLFFFLIMVLAASGALVMTMANSNSGEIRIWAGLKTSKLKRHVSTVTALLSRFYRLRLLELRIISLEALQLLRRVRIRFYFFTNGNKVPLYLRRRFASVQKPDNN